MATYPYRGGANLGYPYGMSDAKISIVVAIGLVLIAAAVLLEYPPPWYPQATGIFPQVVSCVPQHEPKQHTGPNWEPTLKVTVESLLGTVDESGSIGCLSAASTTSIHTSNELRLIGFLRSSH
jgi:hypothetical protein